MGMNKGVCFHRNFLVWKENKILTSTRKPVVTQFMCFIIIIIIAIIIIICYCYFFSASFFLLLLCLLLLLLLLFLVFSVKNLNEREVR